MKKLAILLILALICAPAGLAEGRSMRDDVKGRLSRPGAASAEPTAAPEAPAYDDPLLNIAMDMIENIHTLAGDAAFFELYGVSHTEYAPRLAAADPKDLRGVYNISMPDGLLKLALGFAADLTPAAEARAAGRLSDVFGSLWNGDKGSQALAEVSVLQWSRPYLSPEGFAPCTWIIDCGGALYWASFTQSNEGIMTVSVSPLLLDEGEDFGDVEAYLNERIQMVGVRQIWPESE